MLHDVLYNCLTMFFISQPFGLTNEQREFASALSESITPSAFANTAEVFAQITSHINDSDKCILGVDLAEVNMDAVANDVNKLELGETITTDECKCLVWACFMHLRDEYLKSIIVCTRQNIEGMCEHITV